MIFLDTSFVDRNRAQQEFVGDGDNVIFYVGSALLGKNDSHFLFFFYHVLYNMNMWNIFFFFWGASLEGKNGTQENFPTDKEDLVPEVVGAIPSEDVIVGKRNFSLLSFFFFLKNLHMLSLVWE